MRIALDGFRRNAIRTLGYCLDANDNEHVGLDHIPPIDQTFSFFVVVALEHSPINRFYFLRSIRRRTTAVINVVRRRTQLLSLMQL